MAPPKGASVLDCRLTSAKVLADALGCIAKSQATKSRAEELTISPGGRASGGLRFAVEDFGCLQAHVLLGRENFSDFTCADENLCIRVSLSELMDCLNILAGMKETSPALKVDFEGTGHPLIITLQERDISITSALTTIDGTHMSDFCFLATEVLSSIIMQSDVLYSAFVELEYGNATVADLSISPDEPKFKLESSSGAGTSLSILFPDPAVSHELFTTFKSLQTQIATYRLNLLRRCVRALSQSDTTRLRMNSDGMLALTMKLRFPSPAVSCFIEFYVVAEEINDLREQADEDETQDETQGTSQAVET
mmetsp:Transcript_6612/g.20009  ORF Transcript_6612/g.20009 Transcript_6612/m.20009 type:complete len:309 (-) Transcript_6612:1591-2517(-)